MVTQNRQDVSLGFRASRYARAFPRAEHLPSSEATSYLKRTETALRRGGRAALVAGLAPTTQREVVFLHAGCEEFTENLPTAAAEPTSLGLSRRVHLDDGPDSDET